MQLYERHVISNNWQLNRLFTNLLQLTTDWGSNVLLAFCDEIPLVPWGESQYKDVSPV